MSEPYLAMYLSMKTDFVRHSLFVPIRLFAESTQRLSQDIIDKAFFTTMDQAKDAIERINKQQEFQVCVLLDSTLPGRDAVLRHSIARQNMTKLHGELFDLMHPNAPVIDAPELSMNIAFGMKRATTPYPDEFVAKKNFEGEAFQLFVNDARVRMRSNVFNGAQLDALIFDRPTGQLFFVKM